MVGKKNDGSEFDDDSFDDVEDFSDADYDADGFEDDNEFSDVNADDVDYADEDFGEDEWQQDDEPVADKKGKKGKTSDGKKKGLSFNTIVIIGAVVIGFMVLVMNVSGEKTKRSERNPQEKTMFQSIMSMSGVMDGVLSGENEETAPTAADLAAREQRTKEEGFLNNPDAATPPQPTPISPAETADPLMPLPETATPTPRGPDEVPPADAIPPLAEQEPVGIIPLPENDTVSDVTIQPAEPAQIPETAPQNMSAEDVLKQAMANREKRMAAAKSDEQAEDAAETEIPAPSAPVARAVEKSEPAEKKAAEPFETVKPEPVIPSPEPAMPVASAANDKTVAALEGKIDTLLSRIDQLESDLSDIKSDKNSSYDEIEQSVSALREDMREIKNRPVVADAPRRAEPASSVEEREEPAAEKPKPVVKKAAKKPAAPKPAATVASSSSRWELRAAQPGRAWVSKPGERDMRGIEVGQSLPGIGTITAINYQNGRWTVYGTQGQINQ